MRSKNAIYNVFTNLILQIIVVIYGFVVPKIIISQYGSEVNGLVMSITQFLAYITLLESGFGPVVKATLYKPIADKDNKTIASILLITEKFFKIISYIFLVYIFILAIIYPLLINSQFDTAFTISLLIIISISTFAEYYFGMTYKLFLQANQKTYIISIIQIVSYILSVSFIIVLAKLNVSIHILKLVSGVIFVFRPFFLNLYVKKKFKIDLKSADKNFNIKQKWDGLAQHIASVIHNSTDITIITIFCNLIEVSVYSVYSLVVKGLKSLIQAFTSGIDATFGDMMAKGEKDNLNKKFTIYEILYNTISTIAFTSAMVLIVSFVTVYTKNITDANYIRESFGVLIVLSEYIWAIRLPYSSITLAAGHFKETRKGAWIECLSNIIISVLLVKEYGIIGVAIGTIVAMTIRTIEFVYHTNKYILNRSIWESIKKIVLVIIETIVIIFICSHLNYLSNTSYINWSINALLVAIVASAVTISLNYIFYRKEFNEVIKLLINLFKRKKAKN